jgi:hypothetical protein
MAKTETSATLEEVDAAYEELKQATDTYLAAMDKFSKVFDCNTVSMDGVAEDLENMLFEINENINFTFEDEINEDDEEGEEEETEK